MKNSALTYKMLYVATSVAKNKVNLLINELRHLESKLSCKIHINIFQPVDDLKYISKKEPKFLFSNLLGFKTLFWKSLSLQKLMIVYPMIKFIWLPDSDMGFQHFNINMFIHNMQFSNTYILQPSPYGPGNGHYKDAKKCNACDVCLKAVVEVKMPLFRIEAWDVVHTRMLQSVQNRLLTTDFGMDLIWCGLIEDILNISKGYGCGVSFSTKIEHYDTKEIKKNNVTISKHLMHLYGQKGLNKYVRYPSWRISKHPCVLYNHSILTMSS